MSKNNEYLLHLLEECGFVGEPNTYGELPLQFCPFHEHHNRSPSLRINVDKKLFTCYSCRTGGHIRKIFYHFGIYNEIFAKIQHDGDFEERMKELIAELEVLPEEKNNANILELQDWRFIHPYVLRRGFGKQFLIHNEIGFNSKTISVTVPIYFGEKYHGSIQRIVVDGIEPRYKYPDNLQKSALVYEPKLLEVKNNDVEFWVEGCFDALKIAMYGYRVKCILGCNFSPQQIRILNESKYTPIMALDNDVPGRKGIGNVLSRTSRFDINIFKFPETKKDPGELLANEIEQGIKESYPRVFYKLYEETVT